MSTILFYPIYFYHTEDLNAKVQSILCCSLVSIITMLCVGVIFSQFKCFRKTSSILILHYLFEYQ
jgi:hypothetical protein